MLLCRQLSGLGAMQAVLRRSSKLVMDVPCYKPGTSGRHCNATCQNGKRSGNVEAWSAPRHTPAGLAGLPRTPPQAHRALPPQRKLRAPLAAALPRPCATCSQPRNCAWATHVISAAPCAPRCCLPPEMVGHRAGLLQAGPGPEGARALHNHWCCPGERPCTALALAALLHATASVRRPPTKRICQCGGSHGSGRSGHCSWRSQHLRDSLQGVALHCAPGCIARKWQGYKQ